MIKRRLLYLDAHRLTAYAWVSGTLAVERVFETRSEDHLRFADYLRAHRDSHFQMLANVSEEGYLLETIPFLRGGDRQTLITRKIGQHFLGTQLASAISLGFEKNQRKNEKLLLCALTNPAHFAPWLKCIEEADAPLAGIYTVAQLGGVLLQKMRLPTTRCMLLTLQDHSIRETYLVKGQPLFSRMAPLTDSSIAGIASAFAAEAAKLLLYLVSQRQLGRNDALPVYILAHPQAAAAIRNTCRDTGNLVFEVLDTHTQARQIGLKTLPENNRCDLLFLHLLVNAPPRQQFASEEHRHDYRISQIRYGLIALGAVALLGGTLFAAKGFYETYRLQHEALQLSASESEMNLRYQEVAATFPQIGIDNSTLRRVTTRHGELLKQQRLPDAAYGLIAKALDRSPSIQLESLDWRLGEATQSTPSQSTPSLAATNKNQPVLDGKDEFIIVHGIIRIEAGASPRQTLSELEKFIDILRVDRNNEVKVLKQPFETGSGQALRGSDKDEENSAPRQFSVQIKRTASP